MLHIKMRVWVYPDGMKERLFRVTVEHMTFSDEDGLGDPPRIMRQTFSNIQAASGDAAITMIAGGLERTLRADCPDITFDIGPLNEN